MLCFTMFWRAMFGRQIIQYLSSQMPDRATIPVTRYPAAITIQGIDRASMDSLVTSAASRINLWEIC